MEQPPSPSLRPAPRRSPTEDDLIERLTDSPTLAVSDSPGAELLLQSSESSDDEEEWEDLPHKPGPDLPPRPPAPSPSPPPPCVSISASAPRKRFKTVFVASSPNRKPTLTKKPKQPAPLPLPPKQSAPRQPAISNDEIIDELLAGAAFAFRFSVDVLSGAVPLLRRPLSFLLFLWFLAAIITRLKPTFHNAFSPFCYVPGISSFAICRLYHSSPHPHDSRAPKWADYPSLVNVQSATFEQLLDESAGGSGLALEIKKAEMATSDLITLVRVSELRSRDMLADTLAEFVEDARKAGRGLQKLNAKVGSAVDGILAVNDYALREIEASNRGSGNPSLVSQLIWPFSSSRTKPTNDIVTKTFTESLSVLSSAMTRLILEAETSLSNLDKLEERLTVFHTMITREDASLASAKSELLSELWTRLGGNRRTLRGYDEHIYLLKNLATYRKKALVHVVTALQTLQGMSEDMEELRERVSAPEIVGGRIPVEVHVKSIRTGLERLREGRIKAREREDEAVRRVLSIADSD